MGANFTVGHSLAARHVLLALFLSCAKDGRPHSLRMLMEQVAELNGTSLNIVLETDGLPTIKSLIMRGLGATVFAYVAVTREVSAGMLTAVPLTPGIRWRLAVASHRERSKSLAAREMIRLIIEEVHELVRLGVWQGSRGIDG